MSRPTMQGITFFSLDVSFNSKMELYLLETGATGMGIFVGLLQLIYKNEGYYIENNKDLPLLLKKHINADIQEAERCVKLLIEREIFNKALFNQYGILTSTGIQKRYFDAGKRKKIIIAIDEYLLIDTNSFENVQIVNINGINVNKNEINVCKNTTKEKEEEKEQEKEKEKINILSEKHSDDSVRSVNKNKNTDSILPFEEFWNLYDKKESKLLTEKKYSKISEKDRELIKKTLQSYISKTPDKKYRKNPLTYLNSKLWLDEPEIEKKQRVILTKDGIKFI